jgi:AcrR family transcriptional regulator
MTDQSVIMNATAAETKKTRILDSARQLLIKRGFQDITMDDAAREAGVAKGTLFLYYKTKDELLSAVYADLVDQLGSSFDNILASGLRGDALLTETARVILVHFDRNRDFMSQFGAGRFPACGARSCERLMDKFRENNLRLCRILSLAFPHPARKPRAFDYEAFAFFGLCRGAMLEKLAAKSGAPLADQTRKVINFFLNGARGAV